MYKDEATEQAVLACLMISEDCRLDYELLKEEDFTNKTNKEIYIAIKELTQKEKEVDYLTVHNQLNKKVPMPYLAKLANSLPTTANYKQYVEQLKDLTLKRKLYILSDQIRNPNLSGKELTEMAEEQIFNLREDTKTSEFTKVGDIAADAFTSIQDKYSGKEDGSLKTGYPAIDQIMKGMRKKEYIILGARPSIGKTALAINIAQNLITKDKTVAFFSFEMSQEQLVDRLVRGMALVDSRKIYKEKKQDGGRYDMTEKDWKKLLNTANYLLDRKLFIDEDPNKSVADMLSMCRKLKKKHGLDLVIVDYLQKIKATKYGVRREQLEQISNDLKNMAKALDVPVLVISSLSRATEQRNSRMPIMSDLRETGQIEFDADVIMFLHREYYYKSEESLKHDADVIIAKNRNGAVGRAKLLWFEEYTRFISVSEKNKFEEER